MSFRRCLGVTALVSTAILSGCAETDSIEDLDEPEVAPMVGGTESGGTNGGSSDDQKALRPAVLLATNFPLIEPGTTNTVHPAIAFHLLSQPNGPAVFKYAVQCGLRKRYLLQELVRNAMTFPAKGHLVMNEWESGPLPAAAKGNLFACMATLINAVGAHVPIVIEGGHGLVRDDYLDHSEFDVMEAGWFAEVFGSEVVYTVWPTRQFGLNCPGDFPPSVFHTRVCGMGGGACNFNDGGLFEDHCQTDATGGTKCDGKDVLVTRLRMSDFATLNPTCPTPPGTP